MAQHVRVNWKGKLCSPRCSLNHPQKPSYGYWRACLGHEDVGPGASQRSQCAKLWSVEWMYTLDPTLGAIDVKTTIVQINLSPTQLT
jgi:hypothetical protein